MYSTDHCSPYADKPIILPLKDRDREREGISFIAATTIEMHCIHLPQTMFISNTGGQISDGIFKWHLCYKGSIQVTQNTSPYA